MADIIGLSCRFPESNGPAEFWSNLMDGTDMLTCDDRRWPVGFQGLPPRSGKAPGFDKFDAAFFSVHGKQAQVRRAVRQSSKVSNILRTYHAGSAGLRYREAV
jgi:hypothetical protein